MFLLALAETTAPLRSLLSKKIDFVWSAECQLAFQALKTKVTNIVEQNHFVVHEGIRIVCDASHAWATRPRGLAADMVRLKKFKCSGDEKLHQRVGTAGGSMWGPKILEIIYSLGKLR